MAQRVGCVIRLKLFVRFASDTQKKRSEMYKFGLVAIICFASVYSENIVGEVMGNQLLRSPVAVILQITPEAIYHMKTLLRNEALPKRDIIFYAAAPTNSNKDLHDMGVEGKSTNVQQLSDLLNNFHYELLDNISTALPTLSQAIASLNQLPFDSAVILTASLPPSDLQLAHQFTELCIRQRARFYVIWTGKEDVGKELREMALKTGGAVYNAITDSVTRQRKLQINADMVIEQVQVNQTETTNDEMYDVLFDTETESDFSRVKRQQVLAEVIFPDENNKTIMSQQKSLVSIPIYVELASGTNLEIPPGPTAQLTFQIFNNNNQIGIVSCYASGEGVIVQSIQPTSTQLMPMEKRNVEITFRTIQQAGGSGRITLTVGGSFGRVSRSAMFYITSTPTTDAWWPDLTYTYKGDCRQFDKPTNCDNGQWGVEAVFTDRDSGLLKILSEPIGLLFSTEFIAGTKSPVTVNYLASCCKPRVDIWAEDLKGNYRRKSFDVFHPILQDGEIAAVVLGLMLLIVIILLIIVTVLYCRKRKSRWDVAVPRSNTK